MKKIKSFRLFENQFQIENEMNAVIQEIEDILISGGIKDMGYKFEVKNMTTLPLNFHVQPMVSRLHIYIYDENVSNFTPNKEVVDTLERVVEYAESEGLSHTIGGYGCYVDKYNNYCTRNFNSISEIEGISCDTILLNLKQ
jgi:hypothetical protein